MIGHTDQQSEIHALQIYKLKCPALSVIKKICHNLFSLFYSQGTHEFPLKNFSPFGAAVWPAIANI